jgi:predicted  nucleic acid-binding Zn-ribbon protein
MTIGMRETIQILRTLQELDEDIYRVQQELKRLPEERQRRRVGIDAKLAQVEEVKKVLVDLRGKIGEIESLAREHRQRIRKLEGEAAKSADASIIAACQHEIRSLKREISEADEEGLGLLEHSEEAEGRRTALLAEIAEDEKVFAEYEANVESESGEARAKLEGLQGQRAERMSSDVKPEVLTTYENLLQARDGVALAQLVDRICQGCYMGVPSNVQVKLSRGAELICCPSCDRILYLDD